MIYTAKDEPVASHWCLMMLAIIVYNIFYIAENEYIKRRW